MKKKGLLLSLGILLILLTPTVLAGTIAIGVEPTIIDVYLNNDNKKTYVPMKFYNPSDTPMNFTVEINDDLKQFMHYDCKESTYSDYWCEGRSYRIEPHTDRLTSPQIVKILFLRKSDEEINLTSSIRIFAQPITGNVPSTVAIRPSISVKVSIYQTKSPISPVIPQENSTPAPIQPSNPAIPTGYAVIPEKIPGIMLYAVLTIVVIISVGVWCVMIRRLLRNKRRLLRNI